MSEYAHEHKYFLFKTFADYEPYDNAVDLEHAPTLYRKIELAILGCSCGSVIKSEIKQQ